MWVLYFNHNFMALSEAPLRDEVITSIQALPGVEKFEWGERNWFKCVTITEWTDYHSFVTKMDEAGLDCSEMFIHDPKRGDGQWFQFHSTSNIQNLAEWHDTPVTQAWTFESVDESFVSEHRFNGRLIEALQTENKDWFEKAMKNPWVPPSPHDIVARLDWMGKVHREKWLALHPEHQHLWDNREVYLNPVV